MLLRFLLLFTAVFTVLSAAEPPLPDLKMQQNGLPFRLIDGYENYRIVATHYRTDKHELRYILANPVAYDAFKSGKVPLPEGSKVVKIGWKVVEMNRFPAAYEAGALQRVEFMYKDESWKGDTNECAACHAVMADHDFLFTTLQKLR